MRVRGIGPTPCDLMIVGSNLGWQEDKTGVPFCGRVGEDLDHHLDQIGLSRDDVFLTNLYRQYGGKDYEYTKADLERDEPDLLRELAQVKPRVIVTLGRAAMRYFLGDVDLDATWGIPWSEPPRVIVPIHMPGGWNPEQSPYVVAGFTALGQYLQTGTPVPRVLFNDPYPEPSYVHITTEAQLREVLPAITATVELGTDTEGSPRACWSVQGAVHPGAAFLIRGTDTSLLRQLGRHLRRVRPRVIYHSALHDLPMMRALELPDDLPFDDTMVMAYLLQLEPQGLKPGSLRHCNMQMESYDDILGDAENRLAIGYLTWIWDWETGEYEWARRCEFEARKAAGKRIRVLPKLPKTPLLKAIQRCLQSRRPRGLWLDQDDAIQAQGVRVAGFIPDASLSHVEAPRAIRYGCRDADATIRYKAQLWPRIVALGLEDTYRLEIATYPLIDRMARIGVKPDLAQFEKLSGVLGMELEVRKDQLCRDTGRADFNANSGDHVAAYLFDTCGLEPIKWTRGSDTKEPRGSTNDKILEALEREHPEVSVIGDIRSYREYYKLKYTFVDQIGDFLNRWPYDGRVHTTFRTTRVITGRLAASDPNLLAQPEHGEFAPEFKRGWVAEPGHVIYAADESQIELRGLAHLSQDPVMLAVYRGERRNADGSLIDLHAALAQRIFGGAVEQYMHKCQGRLAAKAINFGIPMGMTCRGLSVELRKNGVDADEEDAQRWLDETLGLYQGVRAYMDTRIAEARHQGWIRCLSGRIRYIGGINSRDERVREEAERFAFSTPIQESATFIMKQAEVTVWNTVLPYFWSRGQWVEPILQIHDCLKLECDESVVQELHPMMVAAMTQVSKGFSVPLAVEAEYGPNMADMETL